MTGLELAIVLLSALLHAAWSVSIKGSRDPLAFNALQLAPQMAVAAILFWWIDWNEVPIEAWWLLLGTSTAHALYLYWMSRAYETADISLVYPIARSTPAFLPLLAVPLLGEQISLLGGIGIAVVVAGMWLVHAEPGFRLSALLEKGTVFAYLTLACTIAYGLFDKQAMANLEAAEWSSPIPRALFYYFAIEVCCGLLFLGLSFGRLRRAGVVQLARQEWPSVLAACFFTVGSYGLILEALRTAQASYVVATRQVSVLFVVAMSVMFLGEHPSRLRILGAAATVVGVALIGVAK